MKYALIILLSLIFSSALAEIHREAAVCDESGEMCFFWWPKLPAIDGWQQDKDNSYHYAANTQVPVGFNIGNADSIIYAKAVYKSRQSEATNLEEFIIHDRESFLQRDPALQIDETKPVRSGRGTEFRSFSFKPQNEGNWEQVSYGEETDSDGNEYFLVFVLSARSESSYKKTLGDYKKFITNYK